VTAQNTAHQKSLIERQKLTSYIILKYIANRQGNSNSNIQFTILVITPPI